MYRLLNFGRKKPIVLFSTKKQFWPPSSFIMKWAEYAKEMEREGRAFLSCEQYYTMQKQLSKQTKN